MPVYAVQYRYDDRAEVRDTVRPEHRAFLRELLESGTLLASGPWTDGAPGALLVVRAESSATARAALAPDPFQREGLVAEVEVRGWDPVLGPWATA